GPLDVESEVADPVPGERIGLHERALVEQELDALARRELAAAMLLVDGLAAAAELRVLLAGSELLDAPGHRLRPDGLSWDLFLLLVDGAEGEPRIAGGTGLLRRLAECLGVQAVGPAVVVDGRDVGRGQLRQVPAHAVRWDVEQLGEVPLRPRSPRQRAGDG